MKTEQTMNERIKTALIRQREQMRRSRYTKEFSTVYGDNQCAICGKRFMTGVICRKYRGNACEKHCMECRYFEERFWHCLYRETEPIDMRKWKLIYGCSDKSTLWIGIYFRELISADRETAGKPSPLSNADGAAAARRADAVIKARSAPKYAIREEPDDNGDYAIVDTDTGEICPIVAKYLENIRVWAAVEYLPPDA